MAASSRAPKHDFAPSWLKIPDNKDNLKSCGQNPSDLSSRNGRPNIRRDDYHNYRHTSDVTYNSLQKQRSFENYNDERRYSPQKFRHHSLEGDYYSDVFSSSSYNGYYGYSSSNKHFRSQPPPPPPNLYRDSKYAHPNSRYPPLQNGPPPAAYPAPSNGPGNSMNPYYDPYAYDYYHGNTAKDPFFNGNISRSAYTAGTPKRLHNPSRIHDGRSTMKQDSNEQLVQTQHTSNSQAGASEQLGVDDDFPSLNGEADVEDKTSLPATTGAWEKPSSKVHSPVTKAAEESVRVTNITNSKPNSNSLYKALVPNKSSALTRKSGSVNLKDKVVKDVNSNSGGVKPVSNNINKPIANVSPISNTRTVNSQKPALTFTKEGSPKLPTPSINIGCNQPSEHKLTIMKPIRNSNNPEPKKCDTPKFEQSSSLNGVNEVELSSEAAVLSSSMEAEERLLREMGWNETDGDEYEITEDDMKEFQNLSKKFQKNGIRSSMESRPKISMNPLSVAQIDFNETLSTTSDSEDEHAIN